MEYRTIPRFKCCLVRDGEIESCKVGHTAAAIDLLRRLTGDLPNEEVWLFFLNGRNDLIGHQKIAQGGLHGCALTPGDVFRGVFLAGAAAFIMGHNHPSGDPKPSHEDIAMTTKIAEVGRQLGVPLLDHVICGVGTGEAISMRDAVPRAFWSIA